MSFIDKMPNLSRDRGMAGSALHKQERFDVYSYEDGSSEATA